MGITGNKARPVAAACIIFATIALVLGIFEIGVSDYTAAKRDFIEYWATGTLLLHGNNPYDIEATLQLEHEAGLEGTKPRVTFSPPVLLFLLLPLGLLSAKSGFILWSLMVLSSLFISVWLLWILNGRPDSGLHFCGYMFAPAIACLMAGQLGTFLLLGIVLFLYFHEFHPYLAGLALLPCAWKPHLFLPFFIVLTLWSAYRRQYRILVGFAVVLMAGGAVTLSFDAHAWSQYSQMMAMTGVLHSFVPTLSVAMRFWVDPKAVWLQFLPEVVACSWSVWYFWTRRDRWAWMDQGMLLLLVSALCTPYSWFTDEAVLLPAVMAGVYRAVALRRSLIPIAIIATAALLEICAVGNIASHYYLWTVPAWFAWYIYATWQPGSKAA